MGNDQSSPTYSGPTPPSDPEQAKLAGFGYCSAQDIWNNYKKAKQLGKGAYGSVWEAAHVKYPNFRFALKEIRFANPDMAKKALEEAQLLYKFSGNEYILRYIACAFEGQGALIVTELCDGSLHDELVKAAQQRRYLEDALVLKWMWQMAKALAAMHAHNIIHRDIKPGNLLVKDGNLKLADLGIATHAQVINQQAVNPHHQAQLQQAFINNTKLTIGMGTADYMPYEQFASNNYDVSVDVFSLGVVVYEMVTLRNASMDAFQHARSVAAGQMVPHPFVYGAQALANSVSKQKSFGYLRMLLRNILCPRPADRMKASVLCWMLERFYALRKEACFDDFIGDFSAPEAEYMLLQNQFPGKELILRTSSERFCLGLSLKDSPTTVSHFRIDLCDSGSYRLRMHPDGRPGQDMEDYSLDTLLQKAIPLCKRDAGTAVHLPGNVLLPGSGQVVEVISRHEGPQGEPGMIVNQGSAPAVAEPVFQAQPPQPAQPMAMSMPPQPQALMPGLPQFQQAAMQAPLGLQQAGRPPGYQMPGQPFQQPFAGQQQFPPSQVHASHPPGQSPPSH